MRDRIEDLGRLLVLLDNIMDNEVFKYTTVESFTKHFLTNIEYEDDPEERLTEFYIALSSLRKDIQACYDIAKGEDYLNKP